jgi:hypothetical protein
LLFTTVIYAAVVNNDLRKILTNYEGLTTMMKNLKNTQLVDGHDSK